MALSVLAYNLTCVINIVGINADCSHRGLTHRSGPQGERIG
jgi:hypothetical protein